MSVCPVFTTDDDPDHEDCLGAIRRGVRVDADAAEEASDAHAGGRRQPGVRVSFVARVDSAAPRATSFPGTPCRCDTLPRPQRLLAGRLRRTRCPDRRPRLLDIDPSSSARSRVIRSPPRPLTRSFPPLDPPPPDRVVLRVRPPNPTTTPPPRPLANSRRARGPAFPDPNRRRTAAPANFVALETASRWSARAASPSPPRGEPGAQDGRARGATPSPASAAPPRPRRTLRGHRRAAHPLDDLRRSPGNVIMSYGVTSSGRRTPGVLQKRGLIFRACRTLSPSSRTGARTAPGVRLALRGVQRTDLRPSRQPESHRRTTVPAPQGGRRGAPDDRGADGRSGVVGGGGDGGVAGRQSGRAETALNSRSSGVTRCSR